MRKIPTCFKCANKAKRARDKKKVCEVCFVNLLEQDIGELIEKCSQFAPGDRIGIGASGGKDSTVQIHIINKLKKIQKWDIEIIQISIDEGIEGYRNYSLESVKRNEIYYKLPVYIYSYKDLFGVTMDDIVKIIGKQHNCTYCGVLRRQALNIACQKLNITKLLTGHNCDDIMETFLMNLLRGDSRHIPQTTKIITQSSTLVPRIKPFKYTYEKDIVLYAHYENVDYFSTECTYSPFAFRGYARSYVKELERQDSSSLICFVLTAHAFVDLIEEPTVVTSKEYKKCENCGQSSSNDLCQVCKLLIRLPLSPRRPRIALCDCMSSLGQDSADS